MSGALRAGDFWNLFEIAWPPSRALYATSCQFMPKTRPASLDGYRLLLCATQESFENRACALDHPSNTLLTPPAESTEIFCQTPDAHAEFCRHSHGQTGRDCLVD